MLTVKPTDADGSFVVQDERGDPVAAGRARASRTVPGYVTIVVEGAREPLDLRAIRVPADWVSELAAL